MFYHGGMTLGYLAAPPRKEKPAPRDASSAASPDKRLLDDEERQQEMIHPFMTPWHLFY